MKIVLSGVVGVGKSTISRELAKLLKYKIMDEPVTSNPYLDDFYQNPLEYAFKMQVFMLMARSKQLKEAQNFNNVIFDRSILEDPIFVEVLKAQNNMNDRDYEVYLNFYNNVIISSLYFDPQIKPDLIVYLKANLENTIERINLRGRESEKHVPHEYWSLLNKKYEQWYEKEKNNFNFLVIDTNDLTPKEIVQKIIDYIK
ncbi:MAG: deoxynucleoside kinase [Spiroplasma sp. WSS]|uniref:deoxynucleoside kinase n=1 Tax=unclassified Spiroplasma TaxID=2637901 RepID=UPI00122A16AF|nr:deoxynucleoside kinase [Spiroplasma endosymbiont of Lariophagus distinguendus]MBP1526011.1 deoxynucleoside kinase [Spiroplasma ixodetis]MBP1527504.1 deoxynucleoside kinase [Spiroplasma ixodetis]MBP1528703.1 deoxynucleoside kinase [Spiroplasma ixodetis]TLF26653.1 MAG: deoxynucleoside kinase [Spiroplasma sp. WSS]